MPVALFLLIAFYIWLVRQRTRGDGGKALVGEDARKTEKLLGFVRVGLVLASVVLAAAMFWSSTRRGVENQGAVLPLFVIIGTAASYGYTIVAAAKVIGYYREMRFRKRSSTP